MSIELRAPTAADVPRMRALNEAVVPHVNSLGCADFRRLLARAGYARVAVVEDDVAGFLVAFLPEADYDSVHFQWFRARYPSFVYIDRVAVDAGMRRRGIARSLYEDVERYARARAEALACEVNTRPANDGSLRFHRRCGFHPVGALNSEGGAKSVSLLLKPLGERSTPEERTPGTDPVTFELTWLRGCYAIARLPCDVPTPDWAWVGEFTTVSRTRQELSVVCAERAIPGAVQCERGWRCLRLQGPLKFGQIGVLASLTRPLAEAGVGILAISTFDTDYLLVRAADAARTERALRAAGHEVCPPAADT